MSLFEYLPETVSDVDELEEFLSRPTPDLVDSLGRLEGDLIILGAGGKMGPTLARLARRALDEAGKPNRVLAASRFSTPGLLGRIKSWGVLPLRCDLLDRAALAKLPDVPNVIYMAGRKFGSTGSEWRTWAMNAYLPMLVAERYRESRIVAFSTGNVYPLVPVISGGASEEIPPGPIGEYAQSCLGRERMLQYASECFGTAMTLIRLNYAVELRYGILLDLAHKVLTRQPIELAMGHVNIIWQGDANRMVLRALEAVSAPPTVLNVTGPEVLSVRHLAQRLGAHLGVAPVLEGTEADTALLSNAARAFGLYGYPQVPLAHMVRWVADWVRLGGATLSKPTHYEQRQGRF